MDDLDSILDDLDLGLTSRIDEPPAPIDSKAEIGEQQDMGEKIDNIMDKMAGATPGGIRSEDIEEEAYLREEENAKPQYRDSVLGRRGMIADEISSKVSRGNIRPSTLTSEPNRSEISVDDLGSDVVDSIVNEETDISSVGDPDLDALLNSATSGSVSAGESYSSMPDPQGLEVPEYKPKDIGGINLINLASSAYSQGSNTGATYKNFKGECVLTEEDMEELAKVLYITFKVVSKRFDNPNELKRYAPMQLRKIITFVDDKIDLRDRTVKKFREKDDMVEWIMKHAYAMPGYITKPADRSNDYNPTNGPDIPAWRISVMGRRNAITEELHKKQNKQLG